MTTNESLDPFTFALGSAGEAANALMREGIPNQDIGKAFATIAVGHLRNAGYDVSAIKALMGMLCERFDLAVKNRGGPS